MLELRSRTMVLSVWVLWIDLSAVHPLYEAACAPWQLAHFLMVDAQLLTSQSTPAHLTHTRCALHFDFTCPNFWQFVHLVASLSMNLRMT